MSLLQLQVYEKKPLKCFEKLKKKQFKHNGSMHLAFTTLHVQCTVLPEIIEPPVFD